MPSISFGALMGNNMRARSYVNRLPLFTRGVLVAIVAFWAVGVQSVWDLRAWGALVPDLVGFSSC